MAEFYLQASVWAQTHFVMLTVFPIYALALTHHLSRHTVDVDWGKLFSGTIIYCVAFIPVALLLWVAIALLVPPLYELVAVGESPFKTLLIGLISSLPIYIVAYFSLGRTCFKRGHLR